MELWDAGRCKEHSGRCIFASTSFSKIMTSFSEREMVMITYRRNRLFPETSRRIFSGWKCGFRTDHRP